MGRKKSKEEKAKEDLRKLQERVIIVKFQKILIEPNDLKITSFKNSVAKAIAGDKGCQDWLEAEVKNIEMIQVREDLQKIMNSLAESFKRKGKFWAWLKEEVKDLMEVNTFEAFEGADEPDKEQTSASVVDARVEKEYTSESVDEKQTLEPENAVACNKIVHTRDLLDDQLEGIKEEPTDEKTAISAKYREWFETNKGRCPLPTMQVTEKRLTKLQQFEASPGAFHVTPVYLDYLNTLPWGKYSTENYNVEMAKEVLQDDPFCPTAVKNGIDEFIALSKSSQGIIIRLSHSPGVNTAFIACSIAQALNRNFCQLSIGGVADIKGHCQLYWKMVECLKNAGTLDPLVLIDKIDKFGTGLDADLPSALSDLLDPRKNDIFPDHYVNVPIDFSKVLFVCTTDVIEMLPQPPLERMVEITLGDYSTNEKMRIAKHYLKTICKELCIKPEQVEVSDAALRALMENYYLEAGVHILRSYIHKILCKVAKKLKFEEAGPSNEPLVDRQDMQADEKIAIKGMEKVSIDTHNLHEFAGKPAFYPERVYRHQTPVGVAIGLCCDEYPDSLGHTQYRGSIMTIETSAIQREKGKGGYYHEITGRLGYVMRESAEIALTVSKAILLEKDPNNTFFANFDIHLHIPVGAMSKDGPSAGCAMTTALLSLAMKKPVKNDLAMTGEMTLGRKILPIGRVKEKMIGARRNGMTTIIFPSANKMDFCEIAPDMGEDSYVHFVDDYNEIFNLAFGDH